MEQKKYKLPLFVVLALILAAVIAYLPFWSMQEEKSDTAEVKMDIAIVNEDKGATLNEKDYNFGKAFIKNIERSKEHNWSVVSRGIADGGLQTKEYNMMIIIPNDFSQKALSIESQNPEKVKLMYQLNESENELTKAKAEKISNEVLNSFNEKVIDVYFASVIANLNDAKKNVQNIVNREGELKNNYTKQLQDPLKTYTNAFGSISESTDYTKSAFKGLNTGLKDFYKNVASDAPQYKSIVSNFNDLNNQSEVNQSGIQNLTDNLSQHNQQLTSPDVHNQFDGLVTNQQAITSAISSEDTEDSIQEVTEQLQQQLVGVKEEVGLDQQALNDYIQNQLKKVVSNQVDKSLNQVVTDNQDQLNLIYTAPKLLFQQHIEQIIYSLPTLDVAEVNESKLSSRTKEKLVNIMTAAKQYKDEFQLIGNIQNNGLPINAQIKQIKEGLYKNGTTFQDVMTVPSQKEGQQYFSLQLPPYFEAQQITLTLPNGEVQTVSSHGEIQLPSYDEGELMVNVQVKLTDINAPIDIFEPVKWRWTLEQIEQELGTDPPEKPDPEPIDPPEKPDPEPIDPPETPDPDPTEPPDPDPTKPDPTKLDPTDPDPTDPDPTDPDPTDPDPTDPDPTDPPEPEIIEKVINQYKISHQVSISLADVSLLQDATVLSLWQYQKLQAIMESYFGYDISSDESIQSLQHSSFTQLALQNDKSMYFLLTSKDFGQLLKDITAKSIIDQMTVTMATELDTVREKYDSFQLLVDDAIENTKPLQQKILSTHMKAEQLNKDIQELLPIVQQWRDNSVQLIKEQQKIDSQYKKEKTVMFSVQKDFSSILASSESISNEANVAVQKASSVYDTFDGIQQKANEVKSGGQQVIQKANQLASNMTSQVASNNEYAKNFTNVLANSRVGNAPNEDLYSFLSNPIDLNKKSISDRKDTRTTYYLLVIASFIALFTGYVLSNFKKLQFIKNDFDEQGGIIQTNLPITIIAAVIGIIEGLLVGIVSFNVHKEINVEFSLWISMTTLLLLGMVLISMYLLRQLKIVGMFLLLVFLSIYLFFTEALGYDFKRSSVLEEIRPVSPLHYAERLISSVLNHEVQGSTLFILLVIICLIALVANLFVFSFLQNKEVQTDEQHSEGA